MIKEIRHLLGAASTALMLMTSTEAFAHAAHCKDTELGELMKGMKQDLKSYVQSFKQSDQTGMQRYLKELIKGSQEAKALIPVKYENQASGSVDIQRYQQGMDKLLSLFRQLDQAGTDSAAVKPLLSEIKTHSKASHDAFRKDCD